MTLFELKKVFAKQINRIALLILAALVALSCRSAVRAVEWIDGEGNMEQGIGAARKLRSAQKEWSGTLDESLLSDALAEVKRLDATPEFLADDFMLNRIATGWQQGVREIRWLLCASYADNFYTMDERVARSVDPSALPLFYDNRVETLKDHLYNKNAIATGYYDYSDSEKEFLVSRYEALETPMEVGYSQGWYQASRRIGSVMQYSVILLGLMLAGIFSDEFRFRADAVFYGSLHGPKAATRAKLKAGFLVTTVLYWLTVGVYSLIVLGCLGFEGGGLPIQSSFLFWKSMYNVTFRQRYLLVLAMGYVGFLFFGYLVMLLSARTKSPVPAVIAPSLVILLPDFLRKSGIPWIESLLALLPDRLMDGDTVLHTMTLYTLGGKVLTPVSVLVTLYGGLALLCLWLCYRAYRRRPIY